MIQLFYPNIPDDIDNYILKTLHSKWIAQGPKVAEFEQQVNKMLSTLSTTVYSVGTNSTTSALHLSYILAGIKPDDEVITTVFSCVATNLPLLWLKANIVFADIEKETLNIDVDDVSRKISNNTKAIVCMNYGGNPCKLDKLRDLANKYNCKLICDNAHGSILSSTYLGHPLEYWCDYVIYSFQAIKMITTGDGGMITCKNKDEELLLKKLRWFGMDKEEKLEGKWNEDIEVVGYKYHMNDIEATIGLCSLNHLSDTLDMYKEKFKLYSSLLGNSIIPNNTDDNSVKSLCTVRCNDSNELSNTLKGYSIESGKIHYRNDLYSIFKGKRLNLPNMNYMENKYLVIPMNKTVSKYDIKFICEKING